MQNSSSSTQKSPAELAKEFGHNVSFYLGMSLGQEAWMEHFFDSFPHLVDSMKEGFDEGYEAGFYKGIPSVLKTDFTQQNNQPLQVHLDALDISLSKKEIAPEHYILVLESLDEAYPDNSKEIWEHARTNQAALPYATIGDAASQYLARFHGEDRESSLPVKSDKPIVTKDNPAVKKDLPSQTVHNGSQWSNRLSDPYADMTPEQLVLPDESESLEKPNQTNARLAKLIENIEAHIDYFGQKLGSKEKATYEEAYGYGYCAVLGYVSGRLSYEEMGGSLNEAAHYPENYCCPVLWEGASRAAAEFPQYKHLNFMLGSLASRSAFEAAPSKELSDDIVVGALNAYYENVIPRYELLERIEQACGDDRQFADTAYRKAEYIASSRNDFGLQKRFFTCQLRERVRRNPKPSTDPVYNFFLASYVRNVTQSQARGHISDWEARSFLKEAFKDGRGYSRKKTSTVLGSLSNVRLSSARFADKVEPIRQEASRNLSTLEKSPTAKFFLQNHYGPSTLNEHLRSIMDSIEESPKLQSAQVAH